MAFDTFLKIEGVEGESLDEKHKGEIDIHSFSWGVSNAGASFSSGGGGGGGTGRATFQDFRFETSVNKASPKLFLACATGKHFPTAVITHRKHSDDSAGGAGTVEFLKLKLSDCIVTSYSQASDDTGNSDSPPPVPADSFSLNYSKIEWSYTTKDGQTTSATFDRRKNVGS